MAIEAAGMMEQTSLMKEKTMTEEASTMANQPRRIIEPILDASGTLRRIPADRTKPGYGDDRSTAHPGRS
ncbi:MAG TPA: hypothetical protein VF449_02515 [Parvibaculum sp.]